MSGTDGDDRWQPGWSQALGESRLCHQSYLMGGKRDWLGNTRGHAELQHLEALIGRVRHGGLKAWHFHWNLKQRIPLGKPWNV